MAKQEKTRAVMDEPEAEVLDLSGDLFLLNGNSCLPVNLQVGTEEEPLHAGAGVILSDLVSAS